MYHYALSIPSPCSRRLDVLSSRRMGRSPHMPEPPSAPQRCSSSMSTRYIGLCRAGEPMLESPDVAAPGITSGYCTFELTKLVRAISAHPAAASLPPSLTLLASLVHSLLSYAASPSLTLPPALPALMRCLRSPPTETAPAFTRFARSCTPALCKESMVTAKSKGILVYKRLT